MLAEQIALGQALARAMHASIEDAGEPNAEGLVEVAEVEMTFDMLGIKWKVTVVPVGEAEKEG